MIPLPVVSVLCTVYNAERFLAQTIESMLSQTFQQWEMIIVNDASTDRSNLIAHSYDDPRIKIIDLPSNVGRTTALNFGLEFCNAEYLAILDADDLARPDRLLRQLEFLKTNPTYGVAASWCTIIDEIGHKIGRYQPILNASELHQYLGWCDPLVHSSLMWRCQTLKNIGGYGGPPWAEDHYALIEISEVALIGIVPEDLVYYRHVKSSLSHSSVGMYRHLELQLLVLRKAKKSLNLNSKSLRRNRRVRSLLLVRLGLTKVRTGAIIGGFLQLIRGILLDPMIVFYPLRTKEWDNRWHPQRKFSSID
jgi:glycosyltransferase involved in cell wall biosynthesis